ncbi:LPS export ABC transporter permease LptG [Gluconacetobacter entanii]|uniref:LPS export ABC transporter permease LptG n=1 Tax=Gluconacetobacter entanii TaxID=108528 RepID=A0A318PXF5_9PROT|nr:LPS export ABC transporter permease LptG [Gluconacetobacter entanii]MBE7618673.1 LPS export ABC transporter permease LptG [Komagataeibacter sp. FXV2]MCE2577138.1 LPS export ABC transporter permease LptG [Komagataeibacter sp. FNDCR1]MBY4639360.1 LPS export ABC transporter permease LptG [Gluconacetobacter entanii]MCW4580277.1 LPS export ABC transporter permease LptG [Gluconacetobacter entanii]MCW4583657.1 LPS export ABC transporter permease LptG [Gluconacetobacter entanii]
MTFARTLSLYIARQFTYAVLAVIAFLTGLITLFDFIDLLRRVSSRPNVPASLVSEIAVLHIPFAMLEILPFGVLLGGIICFWRLARSSELVVARAAGISAWQFLAGPVGCAIMIGALSTTVISPLSSAMYRRAEILDQQYLRESTVKTINMSGGALWMRQSDNGLVDHGVAIVHARRVRLRDHVMRISGVSIFRLDGHDHMLTRIEAAHGYLGNRRWVLEGARLLRPDENPVDMGQMTLPADLTLAGVQDSLASPNTLSVWALPGFIKLLNRSGFSSIRHRLRFQSLLTLPVLCGTMALVAAGFSMRPARRGGVVRMISLGVGAGFALFAISKIAAQFGESGALPPVLAAWAPTGAGLCLAVSLLLHLEDG